MHKAIIDGEIALEVCVNYAILLVLIFCFVVMRIVVDQSYHTYLQSCIMTHTNNYCRSQIFPTHRSTHIQAHDYILVEDEGFDMILTSISRYTAEPCTIQQFKILVDREIALGQMRHHITTEIMTFLISETKVNNDITLSPWGHTGQIECQVQLIMLKSKLLPKHIVADCKRGLVRIIPKSLYTIEYLNQHTPGENYTLLYLEEHVVKCIVITNHQYHNIHYLNRGLHELRSLMQDMNIDQYYNYSQTSQLNQLTRNLINKAVDNYMGLLGNWIKQHSGSSNTIVLISRIQQPIIQEQCIQYLANHYGFYTIDGSSILPRVSKHGDTDAQVYLASHPSS